MKHTEGPQVRSPRLLSSAEHMSTSAGDVEPRSCSDLIDLDVVCLNGEGCRLELSNPTLDQEVYQMVSFPDPSWIMKFLATPHS